MISFAVYKLIHLIGLFSLFFAAGVLYRQFREEGGPGSLKSAGYFGGVGMFLILLGGFGMLARLEIHGGFPGWIYAKLALWTIAALMLGAVLRQKLGGGAVSHAFFIVGAAAGFLALWKPF